LILMARAAKGTKPKGKAKAKRELGEYERKRDFEATPEPAPKRRRGKKGAPRFVVQEHSARRLHWDLRLEHDGVAASWAVPNGIPDDPSENRKAVHTEDHPLEYLEWEGEIPEGEYGAGTMRIWDRGTYELEKWEAEKVMVRFEGERLRGRYALFHAGKDEKDWMIHRIDPPAEARDPFPEKVVPMLAKLAPLPADDSRWAVEVKWDGVRALAYCRPGRLELQTRNLNVVTAQYPEVRRLARQLGSRDAVLDGELVAFDEEGRPSFERLQQRIHQTDANVVRRRMKSHPVTYVVFDLLYLEGRDLMEEPYSRRRELLEGLGLDGESWQTPGYSVGHAAELLAASAEQRLEGIVLKRLDSRYAPGKRNGAWLKAKTVGRQEFVIGGWVPGEGRRRNRIGAILLGAYGEDGQLHYAGKVGTGFSERELDELLERLRPLARDSNPFAARRGPRNANHVEPELVAEIEFRELTAEGMVRHGSFKGLREDKAAAEVVLERAAAPVAEASRPPAAPGEGPAAWYASIGNVLLPHLRGRLLAVASAEPVLVEDLDTVLAAVAEGTVELRAPLALADDVQRPTAVVFDLDPGAPAGLLDCAQVALWIRGMFEQLGLRSYAKTAGSTGIQVYAPLNTEVTYARTRPFAKAVAETLASRFPDLVAARTAKSARAGKVLVDWRQNDEHKTTVCVYSLRARGRAVSTPLEWDELEDALTAGAADRLVFDHAATRRRIEQRGDLFAPLLSEKQHLPD
jgi:bifunctional non-homologous end joining protein LigD